jgi:hypothetical protein
MFGFFLNGEFQGFWSNKVGDKFFDLTCAKMKWPLSATTLVYYSDLSESDLTHAEPTEDSVKVYREETIEGEGGEGEAVYSTQKVLVKTIQGDKFVLNGVILKPC